MLQLSDREWAEFKVGDLFNIFCGKVTTVDKSGSKFPIVSACTTNNAIIGYTDDESKLLNGNCLTIGQQTAFCTYQENKFVATNNVDVLVPIDIILNKNTGLFLCTVINNEINGKFNYGRKLSASRAVEVKINLPITQSGTPDYQFMHDYIAEREPDYSWATQCIEPNAELSLTDREWAEFQITSLFSKVSRGKRLTKAKRIPGEIPLVTAGYLNYGVGGYIGNTDQIKYNKAITIDMFGNCFYRGTEFCCDDNIIVLQNDNINEYAKVFISAIIDVGKDQYNYGNQYRLGDLQRHVINLPITQDGTPDYDFMAQYIKSLPFSKVLEA